MQPRDQRDLPALVDLQPHLLRQHDRWNVGDEPGADDLSHDGKPPLLAFGRGWWFVTPSGRSDADVLHVAVEIERPLAALAADPAVARAAERRPEIPDEEAVHPHGASHEPGAHALGPLV